MAIGTAPVPELHFLQVRQLIAHAHFLWRIQNFLYQSRGVLKNNELAESVNFLFFNKISTCLLTWIQVFKAKTLLRVK